MKKLAALFLALLLSLSLAAPAALCADEGEPPPPVQAGPVSPVDPDEPEDPDEPLRPMEDDELPASEIVVF